jgi:hypothetical protein
VWIIVNLINYSKQQAMETVPYPTSGGHPPGFGLRLFSAESAFGCRLFASEPKDERPTTEDEISASCQTAAIGMTVSFVE